VCVWAKGFTLSLKPVAGTEADGAGATLSSEAAAAAAAAAAADEEVIMLTKNDPPSAKSYMNNTDILYI